MAFELTREQRERALAAFMEVLDNAVPPYELDQFELFPKRDREFIRREVERKLYEPKLPWGGGREQSWVEKLMEMSRDTEWNEEGRRKAAALAQKFKEVDGVYYTRSPITENNNKEEFKWLHDLIESAQRNEQWDRKWFAEMLLAGFPRPVTDFKMVPLFLMNMADGTTDRLVQLENVMGENTGPVAVPTSAFHAPVKFREWCLSNGGYAFGTGDRAGEKELQMLQTDTNHALAWKQVMQVVSCGWHPLKAHLKPEGSKLDGIWFFGDCAYADGVRLIADKYKIYPHDGKGYLVAEDGRENPFFQKRPLLFPEIRCESLKLEITAETRAMVNSLAGVKAAYSNGHSALHVHGPTAALSAHGPPSPRPSPQGEGETSSAKGASQFPKGELELNEPASVGMLFREMTDRLRRTMGGLEAWLVTGSVAAYAAAPEIFNEYSLFPGLWVHGQAGSGKSTIMEWLIEMWGFHVHNGLSLKGNSVSAVGLLQASDQYSNLPVWADEFRNGEVNEDKLGVLHNAFNRGGQAKFNPNKTQRVMRTMFLVSGESTSTDAAMRGRYAHVQVSEHRREKDAEGRDINHARWFDEHRRQFYQIGRFLMEHRAEFAELTLKLVRTWRESAQGVSERDKLVYGIPGAAFTALAATLQSHTAAELTAFKSFLVRHAGEASADVVSELNINVFWTELLNAYKAGDVPVSCFRCKGVDVIHPPGRPEQGRWRSYKLFIDPNATLSAMATFLTRQRSGLPLKRKDLRDQLSKNGYWIEGKNGSLKQRFSLGGQRGAGDSQCWGIEIDEHPLGYQEISNEEYEQHLLNRDGGKGDPRQGELFLIVNEVYQKERDREKEENSGT